jgi:hypothetical protein
MATDKEKCRKVFGISIFFSNFAAEYQKTSFIPRSVHSIVFTNSYIIEVLTA